MRSYFFGKHVVVDHCCRTFGFEKRSKELTEKFEEESFNPLLLLMLDEIIPDIKAVHTDQGAQLKQDGVEGHFIPAFFYTKRIYFAQDPTPLSVQDARESILPESYTMPFIEEPPKSRRDFL